jgi:hypothetical protein
VSTWARRAAARAVIVATLSSGACQPFDPADAGPDAGDPDGPGRIVVEGFPAPTAPCALDPDAPTRLLVTTTDFATGAVAVVDLATGEVRPDVAPGSTDAVPVTQGDRLFLLHRFGFDRVDELDPVGYALKSEITIASDVHTGGNPHALALAPDGRAFVALFAEPRVAILDLRASPGDALVGEVDLSALAVGDDNPEASEAVACGDRIYVALEQLDEGFVPRGEDGLAVIDTIHGSVIDADPQTPGLQSMPTLGTLLRQVRRDPADPSGTTLLGLSTGIERIDLRGGEVTWAVPASRFVAAGIDAFLRPQSFDVDASGELAYLAVYDEDFAQTRLYRVGLDGNAPEQPEPFAAGFDSAERTLEVVGDALWYGSTRHGESGLHRFDLRAEPPRADGPVRPTGLPPYAVVALP